MTTKYWLKIILGMLAVFAVGMVVATGIKQGNRRVHALIEGTESVTLPMLGAPFMLGDAKLGAIQSMRIERDTPKQVSGFHLKVRLDDPQALETLATCQISLDDFESIDEHSRFICVDPADSVAQDMQQFGTITFQPSGQVHVLLAPAKVRDEMRNAFVGDATDSVDAAFEGLDAQIDSAAGGGNVSVKINGKQIVDIHGDSTGGHVVIKDPATGKTLVEVNGPVGKP